MSLRDDILVLPSEKQRRRKLARTWRKFRRRYLDYLLWRLGHPRRPFHEFYVKVVGDKLDRGESHRALGRDYAETDRAHLLGVMQHFGLQPRHRFVDYGCGSLRLGKHLIDYLEIGHYIGLDVTDRFYRDGLARLDRNLIETKQPELAIIAPESLSRVAAAKPDFIACWHVLSKVPRGELVGFFRALLSLAGRQTRIFVQIHEGRTWSRKGVASWRAPAQVYLDILAGIDSALDCHIHRLPAERFGGRPLSILELRRRGA